ncbi:uncharacterized protein [Diadema setosum]|uniref:uncharacterized protein n=1 Tax=Diadema setosum TaxID=31175 RepID=UPI003B3AC58A
MMEAGYRERQGYYGNERDSQPPLPTQHEQQQSTQQSVLPHYAHQLPHHSSLLPPASHVPQHPLHLAQPSYVLDTGEELRGGEEYPGRHPGPSTVQQIHSESVQLLSNSSATHDHLPHHQQQFSTHSRQQLTQLRPARQAAAFTPTASDQPEAGNQPSASGQVFVTHTPSQGAETAQDDSKAVAAAEGGVSETIIEVCIPTAPAASTSSMPMDQTVPKKRAVRLALAETQQQQQLQRQQEEKSIQKRSSVLPSPPVIPRDVWKPDIPIGLSFLFSPDGRKISGIRAERSLEKGARFGPFNGKLLDEEVGSLRDSSWELCLRGKVFFYVDGQGRSYNNWMAFVQSANEEVEQNMEAFQSYGDIFFRTTKVIEPGNELRVFYSEDYASHVGFKSKLSDLSFSAETNNFPCRACERSYNSAKGLLRHTKITHDPVRACEMRPVVKWEPRSTPDDSEGKKAEDSAKPAPPSKPTPAPKPAPASKPSPPQPKQQSVPPQPSPPPPPKRTVLTRDPTLRSVEERFICTTCGKNFPTRGRLAAHETFHEYNSELTCHICGEGQMNPHILAKHLVTHKAKPFKCATCGNAFVTRNMLSRHERLSHTLNHACRVCGKRFAKKRECSRHEKEHPEWRSFKPVTVSVRRYKRANPKPRRDIEEDVSESELCDAPDHELEVEIEEQDDDGESNPNLTRDMLGKRTNHYDRPRPYKCRFCSKRYLSRKAKTDHEAEVHTKKCDFKCTHCPQVFATEMRYVEHVKRHVENRPFQCHLCPNAFASESALINHQGEHNGQKPIKCDVCGRGFRTRHFMTAHKRRMHKVQQMRFACSFCNKPFSDKGNMIKHERRHKGIRPFVCLTCGKGFTSKFCLTSHSYTHTNERRFGCPYCEQKFTLNQHLTNHIYRQHTSRASSFDGQSKGPSEPPVAVEPSDIAGQ